MHKYLQVEGNVVAVDIDRIKPSPFQTRQIFDDEDIAVLSKSICENGLLQPITIRRIGKGQFELVAGERRLRACKMAGIKQISAIICEMNDDISAVFGYIENNQRTDLNPFEQARGIQKLIQIWDITQEQAAQRLGMTQPTLSNKLRLLVLTDEQQAICLQKNLTERHARAVLSVADEAARTSLLKRAGERQMNVTAFEQFIAQETQRAKAKKRKAIMVKDVRIFANTIDRAINFMKAAGVGATSVRQDTSEYIEYVVRIPLKKAYPTQEEPSKAKQAVVV